VELVSYLIKTFKIEHVIYELECNFVNLDVLIKEEGHDFYLIKFNTFNNKDWKVTEEIISSFDLFFDELDNSIISFERVIHNNNNDII